MITNILIFNAMSSKKNQFFLNGGDQTAT